MILDLSVLVIPILSLASGLFLFISSSAGTVEAVQVVSPKVEKRQEIKDFRPQKYHSYLQTQTASPTSTPPTHSLLARKGEVSEGDSQVRASWRLLYPGSSPTAAAAAESTMAVHAVSGIWEAASADTAPLEPLILAKGSRAPPGGGTQ